MAKASRSKQPAFDPGELDDLIFSPAVGSGVGSHLVDRDNMSTVVTSKPSTVDGNITDTSTVVILSLSTEDTSALWITESGDVVPRARVYPIRLARDVINAAEESVYQTLSNAEPLPDSEGGESILVQAGYDYLAKQTRLSKKTIQRIVAKLIDKDFIAIEQPADIYRRASTVYRVFSRKMVLERHARKGRAHVAKMGPGFSYVRPGRPGDFQAATQTRPQ